MVQSTTQILIKHHQHSSPSSGMHPTSWIEVWRAAYSYRISSDTFWLNLWIILLNVLFSIGSTVLWRVISAESYDTVLAFIIHQFQLSTKVMPVLWWFVLSSVLDWSLDSLLVQLEAIKVKHHSSTSIVDILHLVSYVGKAFYDNKGAWPWPVQFLWLSLGHLWK